MYMQFMLLFICINVMLGVIHIPGSPLSVTNSSCFYPDGLDPDPIANNPMGPGDSIDSMADMQQEIAFPTNSTNPGGGETFEGDGNPFPIFDTLSRSWKSLDMFIQMATGGYVFDTIQHITIACEQDKDPNSPTYEQLIPMDDGTGSNAMWEYIKTGFQVIISFIIIITVFYWLTGRGHILSS